MTTEDEGRLWLYASPEAARAGDTVGRPIDAVVFDMDGLLLDTEVLAMRALGRAAEALGLDLPMAFRHLMIGVPVDGCRQLLIDRCGPEVDADRVFAAASLELAACIDAGELRVKPGVDRLLRRLAAEGVPTAVATSSARAKAAHHLAAVSLLQRVGPIVTRDDVARGKPHPDLYLRAAEVLGVAPHRSLALEDSYNGVRAARAAGMPVVMVPDLLPPTSEMHDACHAIVARLDELLGLLVPGGGGGRRQTTAEQALP